jgi:endonuclease G
MPAPAKAANDGKDAYLVKKQFFSISSDNFKRTPNWVTWHLIKTGFGKVKRPRSVPFHPSPELPNGFLIVKPSDYRFATAAFECRHLCSNTDHDATTE